MSSTSSIHSAEKAPKDNLEQPNIVDEYDDSEKNFQPKSIKFWTIMSGIFMTLFLVALDRTIIATAIPSITDEFNSIQDIGWYGSGYMLTAACFIPIFGRIYQLYSTKWVFLVSLVIFEVGSAVCGAAPSSVAFILGRAIAGLGSAGLFSGSMMILIPMVPLRKRPVFSSMFAMTFGISSVLGPIIGGSFTDKVSWRWCFYINLPIGGFTILGLLFFLHLESPKREKLSLFGQIKRLDPIGIFFFVPSVVCLLLALQWGGSTYAWSEPKMIGLLVTFAVLFIAFVVVEVLTPETAMAPTRVVLNRSIAGAMLFVFLLMGGMMSVVYYITIWFQAVKGDSAFKSGISTIPLVLGLVIISIVSGVLVQKVGYYVPAMLIAPLLCAPGAGLLSTLSPDSNHRYWIGYQVLFSCGVGFAMQTSNLAAQTVLPRTDVSIGMALMFFMQQLGGSVFLAVSQNVFSSKLVGRLSGVAGLDATTIVNTGATNLRKVVPASELGTVIEAYNYAITRVFLMAAILGACMALAALTVQWRSIKGKPKGTGPNMEEGQAAESKADHVESLDEREMGKETLEKDMKNL